MFLEEFRYTTMWIYSNLTLLWYHHVYCDRSISFGTVILIIYSDRHYHCTLVGNSSALNESLHFLVSDGMRRSLAVFVDGIIFRCHQGFTSNLLLVCCSTHRNSKDSPAGNTTNPTNFILFWPVVGCFLWLRFGLSTCTLDRLEAVASSWRWHSYSYLFPDCENRTMAAEKSCSFSVALSCH